jgi:cytochrome b involved in lipid metabolism
MTKKASTITIFLESAIIIVLVITLFSNSGQTLSLTSNTTPTQPQVTVVTTPITTKPATPKPVVTTPTPKPVVTTPTPQPGTYTLAQIAQHPNAQSCWTAVNGGVYDVTAWISEHPGGSRAILAMCGRDGSADYNDQHGGERRPANELASFKIGILAQ